MPLIHKEQEIPKKGQVRVRLQNNVLDEMQAYCQWAGVTLDHFLEEAALFVFRKDKSWHKQKTQQSTVTTISEAM